MKKFVSILYFLTGSVLFFGGCTKVDKLPYYEKGTPVTLTASATTVAPTLADSLSPVVSFSWTNPKYATDTTNYKFIVELDTAGRNFSNSFKKEVVGHLSTSFTGRELNDILLNYGSALGVPSTLDVRITSSDLNNNEKYLSN
ncbi:MAG TPA: SusE domain-containing protein, partial [Flavisolibacter sp.]|nr:SusE domain-containing protein [Flavisolibacter sp.]